MIRIQAFLGNRDPYVPGSVSQRHGSGSFHHQAIISTVFAVLRIRIRDPGLGAFLTPGSGMGESQHPDPGSGMNNPDHIFQSLETIFWG
jgi:hypothetical protein